MARRIRWILPVLAACGIAAVTAATAQSKPAPEGGPNTVTPIQHVVVIFGENISFDHYFGTYPNAANTDGRPFHALPGTPSVDGLTQTLLTQNPNSSNPQRLDSSPLGLPGSPGGQLTCDQDHNYTDEQKAFDAGKWTSSSRLSAARSAPCPARRRRAVLSRASSWTTTTATPSPRCGTTRSTSP